MYRPYELRTRRIRKFGKDADQLTVTLFRPVLVVLRSVRDECYQSGVPTHQPRRDVPVVVKAHRSDVPGPDEFGPIVLSHPHVRRIHACPPLPLSHACPELAPAVARRAGDPVPTLRRPRSRRYRAGRLPACRPRRTCCTWPEAAGPRPRDRSGAGWAARGGGGPGQRCSPVQGRANLVALAAIEDESQRACVLRLVPDPSEPGKEAHFPDGVAAAGARCPVARYRRFLYFCC